MLDHVTLTATDLDASLRFYERGFATLGIAAWPDLRLVAGAPPTRRLHLAFVAPDRAAVDAWWRALVDAGYRDAGEPGERPQYSERYYGAFVLDPDGNSAEAVHNPPLRTDGRVLDHLWIRVRDVAATARFYDPVAAAAGLVAATRRPHHLRYRAADDTCSFSFVAGDEPTENVGLAFPGGAGRGAGADPDGNRLE
jgi:catechol 2,3-dioxygenase-like lactoylglutathione lyase family enzyme